MGFVVAGECQYFLKKYHDLVKDLDDNGFAFAVVDEAVMEVEGEGAVDVAEGAEDDVSQMSALDIVF